MTRWRTTVRYLCAVMLAIGLFTACAGRTSGPEDSASESSSDSAHQGDGIFGEQSDGDPVSGGTMRYATWSEPRSLDPTVSIASGSTGGSEMVNIFDSLMRYDAGSGDFVTQLAESLEPNDDFTEWTLILRPNVTFSNGDPLDADAVKFSQERYASAPTSPDGPLWVRNVAGIQVLDARTVRYTLNRPWALFPSALSTGPGMIVAEASIDGENFTPIGAGPFILGTWEERTQITLEANPNYWNGAPHLDSIRFVYFTDPQIAVDALQSKDVDMALARDANHRGPLVEAGYGGYRSLVTGGSVGMINAQEGRPGADPRVRKAIQLATDADALQKRVLGEYGNGEITLFPQHSRWATETKGLDHNLEEARNLLNEAKADGYDGKLQILGGPSQSLRTRNLAFKAQMEAVGFEVESDTAASITDQITRIVGTQDYDITSWSFNFREADPLAKMFAVLHSDGNQSYGGYTSPEFDALVEEFEAATTPEDQQQVMEKLQEQINEDVPFLLWGWAEEVTFWNDNVHGVVGATNTMVMFDKAWLD